jgi:hypothetical protein
MVLSYCLDNDFTHSDVETTKIFTIIPSILSQFVAVDQRNENRLRLKIQLSMIN